MVGAVPAILRGLIDDAAVFPPGNATLDAAVPAHRGYRQSWFEPMVGPLLVPLSRLSELDPGRGELRIGVIVDCEPEQCAEAVDRLDERVEIVHYESRHALHHLMKTAPSWGAPVYAEIPFGEGALDAVAETDLTPKFRTGGPSEEFFPPCEILAAAIVGCARRGLKFKLTAGLHRAIRHRDRETGFVHHGFLNVLAATVAAAEGSGTGLVAEILGLVDTDEIVNRTRAVINHPRPLWAAFGSCSVTEPLDDLLALRLLERGTAA